MNKSYLNIELYIKQINVFSLRKGLPKPNLVGHTSVGRPNYCFAYINSSCRKYVFLDFFGQKFECEASTGDILFIPKGCKYYVSSDAGIDAGSCPYSYIVINFELTEDNTIRLMPPPFKITITEDDELDSLFRKIALMWETKEFVYSLNTMSVMYEIFGKIYAVGSAGKIPEYKRARIAPAMNYIHKNLSINNVSAEHLASLCLMSQAQFRRLFKEIYGINPFGYINSMRIKHAEDLLKTGYYNISEISGMCGFSNVYTFSRAFKNSTGVSPSQY